MLEEKKNKLEAIRHSLSHLMSMAIQELYPQVGLGVGPAIENGFYQDYDLPEAIGLEILPKLEKRMKELIRKNIKFEQHNVDFKQAYKFYQHDLYKTALIDDLKSVGEKSVSFYKSGEFDNLCAGSHVKSSGQIQSDSWKLEKLAGAYWRGDEKNKMLTRIYGLAFATKQELDNYLKMMEEAEKRDHRKLGKELDFFHIDEIVGSGLPLWHPKGAILWRIIEDFWYKEHLKNEYQLVRTPHIGNKILWETSGHWGFYNESMYPPLEIGQTLKENQNKEKTKNSEQFLLKPMNCPFHVQIFKNKPYSYRELPLRWAECGTVYRYEKKGELSGLIRVRGFTQDDAHIICRADQVENELKKVIDFILFIYKSFGFEIESVNVYLSIRDQELKKYAGTNQGWEFTEKVLERVALEKGLNIKKDVGGAVFYGPKLDFKVKDAIGREWQCSTLQFDFNLPERFDMTFVNEKAEKERPYMLHRALFGSFERFIGVLIEHYAGALPVWLSPVQVKIVSVGAAHAEFCQKLADEFKQNDIRVEVDESDETVGNKIRKAVAEKVPYMLVVGDRETASDKLAVRDRGEKQTREIDKERFIKEVKEKIKNRK
ncbi:threonine--tRNA ligase [Patescibacteria group bacterium]|nr:threonine--tRNA ligase [Patescibacteria group bacterium]MBU1663173.1 threonine--tRNA ligase [Patescibacteria group bacterium]MBU1934298.1 threonine--tRNA ligase [Patescibacteria group bacterium]MBU2008145.1 threonine--tRNA ligase [Patescibacteria group bacterium]MBU2233241.1 threonine--tRNA ligase [Patescibacteria group bacterium]